VLKQFDDLLVKILIAAAIVSFLLALVNGDTGLSAFVEPTVSILFIFGILKIFYAVYLVCSQPKAFEKRFIVVPVASCR